MIYTFNPDGWCHDAMAYTIRPRKSNLQRVVDGKPIFDARGKPVFDQIGPIFTPISHGMHPYIKQHYGTARGVTVHCTDVIVQDAGKLAASTANTSPRKSSYTFLIGLKGDLHQLASIFDIVWHAGRGEPSEKYEEKAEKAGGTYVGPRGPLYEANKGWLWPVVDGKVVVNANNWGPGVELVGLPGEPTSAQKTTLTALLLGLYHYTKITPDSVWAHGDLDPLHRTDPGFDVAKFAHAIHDSAVTDRENDGWIATPNPASGPGEAP